MRRLTISVDFDGTIVSNQYPNIGVMQLNACDVLTEWKQLGHSIVINTCRSGIHLTSAKRWLEGNDIPFDYLNENNQALISLYGSDTRKISADIYFDDRNAGGFMGWDRARDYVMDFANRKPLIICIVGESATGKTVFADYLERRFGIPMILSYTDRPRRNPDERGHTFLSKEEFDRINISDIIAYTKYGDYRYCCLHKDVVMENTYVIDEDGLNMLKADFGHIYDIKTIRMTCTEDVRVIRSGNPERVNRDKGRFTIPIWNYDMDIDTTHLSYFAYPAFVDARIHKWLKRF